MCPEATTYEVVVSPTVPNAVNYRLVDDIYEEDDEEDDEEEEDAAKFDLNFSSGMEGHIALGIPAALTDRSNFSVDTVGQEVDRVLGCGVGTYGAGAKEGGGRDWRAAMAAMDDVLGGR